MKIIWNYRKSDSDYELKTRLEIFREIKSSLKDQFVVGAITACEKQLVLSEEADSIEEIVNDEYHRNEGNLTKRACFDAIKDELPSSFNDKAKNVYSSRLAFEEERDDQKLISDELARAKMKAKAGGTELDTNAFFEQLREKHPFKGSAIKFVKHNSDCQTISEQLARAKMEAKAAGTKFDTDAFLEQLRVQHPDKGDAINFVAGREKHNSNVQTISEQLVHAKKAGGTKFDTDAFLEELREKHPDKGDAINFVAGREKRNSDVQTISNELARAKKAGGTEFDTDAFLVLEQLREKDPDKGDAIKFVAGREKHNSDVQTIYNELAKMKAKAAGTEFDTDAFLEELREKHPDKGSAINFVAGRVRACTSVLSKRKGMLKSVITSVENGAKEMDVKECEINCSIYNCVECSEKRSEEYSEFHFAVAADHDGNKQMTCLLCKEQNSIRSGRFRRVESISVEDVREERNKLDLQSKEEKKRKKSKSKESKSKKTKSAPKRKVEVVTSPIPKKRKSSDDANSEGLGK